MFATTCAIKTRRNLPLDRRIGLFSATSVAAEALFLPRLQTLCRDILPTTEV